MADNPEYEQKAKRLLRSQMTLKGVSYAELAERLKEVGVTETDVNLRNKVSRGKFSAAFLIEALEAIGSRELRLD